RRQQLIGRAAEERERPRREAVRGLVEQDLVEDDLQRPRLDHPGKRIDHREDAPRRELATLLPDVRSKIGEDRPAWAHGWLIGHAHGVSSAVGVARMFTARFAFPCQLSESNTWARARCPSSAAHSRFAA